MKSAIFKAVLSGDVMEGIEQSLCCLCAGGMFLANPQTSLSDRRQVSIHRLWGCALKEDYSPLELHANNLLRNGFGKTLLITDPSEGPPHQATSSFSRNSLIKYKNLFFGKEMWGRIKDWVEFNLKEHKRYTVYIAGGLLVGCILIVYKCYI